MSRNRLNPYAGSFLIFLLCTMVAAVIFPYFVPENLSMVYLAGIVVCALYYGRGPSILVTILSVGAFDFLFIKPYGTFAIADVQYVLSLLVMLLVAVTVSSLAVRSKQQAEMAKEREHRTASLYAMNRKFTDAQNLQDLVQVATEHIASEFNLPSAIYIANPTGELKLGSLHDITTPTPNIGIAHWTRTSGQMSGHGTAHLPETPYLYVPLKTPHHIVGVLAVYAVKKNQIATDEGRQILESFGDQIAVAIERMSLTEEAQKARTQAETESLRNSLLSSVSHDLRTPLASIMGAASTLLEKGLTLDAQTHEELAQVAFEEAERLNRLVRNLLDMTRLESGGLKIEKEWQTVEEVIGATLRYLGKRRSKHTITVNLASDLPFIPIDTVLIEQALVNLLDNAIKYTPEGSIITIAASATDEAITIEIADHGPGILPGDEERIFDKFYRSNSNDTSGVGLGLAICRGIIEAHGGHIEASNRPSGGAVFSITLPLDGEQPQLAEE